MSRTLRTARSSAPIGRPRKLTHEAILSAAEQVMEEEGFAALSLRSLALKLGVSHPTLYNYVRHIEDVEAQVLQSMAATLPMPSARDAAGLRREFLELLSAARVLLLKHPRVLLPQLGSSAWRTFSGVTRSWIDALGRYERNTASARAAFVALVSVASNEAELERAYGPDYAQRIARLGQRTFGERAIARPEFAELAGTLIDRLLPGLAR